MSTPRISYQQPRAPWRGCESLILVTLACLLIGGICLLGVSLVKGVSQRIQIEAAHTPLDLARAATIHGHDLAIDGDTHGLVDVAETLDTAWGNKAYRQQVRDDCAAIQRALWSRYPTMTKLKVVINGPLTTHVLVVFGWCMMTRVNALNQPWSEMNADTVWGIADETWLSPKIAFDD